MVEIFQGRQIPLPNYVRSFKYPFGDLNVGDMFCVSGSDVYSARVQMAKWNRRGKEKFTSRKIDAITVGFWRIA